MRVTRPFLAAVVCLVALVGCSSNPPPTVEDAKTSTPFEETTELEPTPEPDRTSFLGSVSITENAGYSMRVDFDVDWGESTSSIINDKPGEATASLPVSSVVIVTNTTSGRTYPASGDPLDFRVELLYRAVAPNTGKPICGSGIMRFWPGPDGADYCSLPVGGAPAQSFFYGPLASGDSTPNLAPNQLPESSIAAVPESMLAEVLAQLEQPDYVVITAPRWWTTTRCQQNGQSVIASLPAIPGCTD